MTESTPTPHPAGAPLGNEELQTALFAQLVLQQSNMALMMMGKVPHPETGETIKDLEAARLFIDTLEMLEARTQGNLNKQENNLLKQTLMNLRLQFVQAVEDKSTPAQTSAEKAPPSQEPTPTSKERISTTPSDQGAAPSAEDEHRKKFSKKY